MASKRSSSSGDDSIGSALKLTSARQRQRGRPLLRRRQIRRIGVQEPGALDIGSPHVRQRKEAGRGDVQVLSHAPQPLQPRPRPSRTRSSASSPSDTAPGGQPARPALCRHAPPDEGPRRPPRDESAFQVCRWRPRPVRTTARAPRWRDRASASVSGVGLRSSTRRTSTRGS